MAVSAGTVKSAYDFQCIRQHSYTDTVEYDIYTCKVDVEWTTTDYATADDATFAPATVIQNAMRDGRTATILQAAVVGGGCLRLAATPTVQTLVGALACTVSTGTVTVQLAGEDWSTELTNGTVLSTSTWDYPATFQVTFKVPTPV